MSKSAPNTRLPRAKGMDMAGYFTPKECSRKTRHLVLSPLNRKIVDEFIAILGMKEKFDRHEVTCPEFEKEREVLAIAFELIKECSFADMEQIVMKAKRKAIMLDQPMKQEHLTDSYLEYNPGTSISHLQMLN